MLRVQSARPAGHSDLGPSRLRRRELCPGSLREEAGLEDPGNEYAAAGTALHAIVADVLRGKITRQEAAERAGGDEAAYAVGVCIDYAQRLRDERQHARFAPEEPLDCSYVHPAIGHGTADLLVVEPFRRALVVDWKFTRSRQDPAQYNRQLWAYAAAASQIYQAPQVDVALVCAYYDNADDVSRRTFYAADLRNIAARLREIVAAAIVPWAPLRPSQSACQYCLAAPHCPALLGRAQQIPTERDCTALPPSELSRLLDVAEGLGAWLGSLQRHAYAVLAAGGELPGHELRRGRKSRAWLPDSTERLVEIAREKGVSPDALYTPRELRSPAEVEKLLHGKKATRDLIVSRNGKLKLVRKERDSGESQ